MQSNLSPYKIAIIAGVGMFLSTLDSGIVNIALPTLMKAFQSNLNTVIWTVTLYTLALSTTILLFGKYADRYGRLYIYRIGLFLFACSSLFCGMSPTIHWLIFSRVLQGISAAMMQATAISLLTIRLKGHDTAKAMGLLGMIIGLGPTLGPVLGGAIISLLSWRWIFWLNIPICLVGIYCCKYLSDFNEALHKQPIHYINLIVLAIFLFFTLLTINFISSQNDWVIPAIASISSLIVYVLSEIRSSYPIIEFSLFKKISFLSPIIGILAFGGATAICFMLPPLFFEKIKLFPTWKVGLICLSSPIGMIVGSRCSSMLLRYITTNMLMKIGLLIMVCALIVLSQTKISWLIFWSILPLFLYGLGAGLFQSPCYLNITAQFSEHKQSYISSLIRMFQNFGIAILAASAALMISFYKKYDLLEGIQGGWWIAIIFVIIAFVLILLVKNEESQHAT